MDHQTQNHLLGPNKIQVLTWILDLHDLDFNLSW